MLNCILLLYCHNILRALFVTTAVLPSGSFPVSKEPLFICFLPPHFIVGLEGKRSNYGSGSNWTWSEGDKGLLRNDVAIRARRSAGNWMAEKLFPLHLIPYFARVGSILTEDRQGGRIGRRRRRRKPAYPPARQCEIRNERMKEKKRFVPVETSSPTRHSSWAPSPAQQPTLLKVLLLNSSFPKFSRAKTDRREKGSLNQISVSYRHTLGKGGCVLHIFSEGVSPSSLVQQSLPAETVHFPWETFVLFREECELDGNSISHHRYITSHLSLFFLLFSLWLASAPPSSLLCVSMFSSKRAWHPKLSTLDTPADSKKCRSIAVSRASSPSPERRIKNEISFQCHNNPTYITSPEYVNRVAIKREFS